MTRLMLKLEEWPAIDQAAWASAVTEGDILDGYGPAAHWRPRTRKTNIRHYGHWLAWLEREGRLDHTASPHSRVTPEQVKAYHQDLATRVSQVTTCSTLVGLKEMIRMMAPQAEWRWLKDVCNALTRTAQPSRNKAARIMLTDEIIAAVAQEFERLGPLPLTRRRDRTAVRDALILGLMAYRPLRQANFSALALGQTLRPSTAGWMIDIPGEETKTGAPITFSLPDEVEPWLTLYLDRVRPIFAERADTRSNALWLGYRGAPLTAHGLYYRVLDVTRRLLGRELNPHLLRDCAATSIAINASDQVHLAAVALSHSNFRTTERHYIRAGGLNASRQITAALSAVRNRTDQED